MVLRAAAVEPEIVNRPVVRQKLAHLILEVVVVLLRVIEPDRPAPLRGRVVQTDLHIVSAAGVGELLHDVALSALPRTLRHRIIRIFTRPVRETVVVLRHEDAVLRAGVLRRPDPAAAVETRRVERRRRHRQSVPVVVSGIKAPYAEMEEHPELPVHELKLLFCRNKTCHNISSHKAAAAHT